MSATDRARRAALSPRSVAAAHAGLVPAVEPLPAAPPRRFGLARIAAARAAADSGRPSAGLGTAVPARRPSLRRRLAALLAAGLVVGAVVVGAAGARTVLAVFTDLAVVGGNTFATGTWSSPTTWYLHDDPTPPAGDTAATALLAMDATAPAGATLFNYDTDCDDRPGRSVDRGTGLADEAGACRAATWRSAPLAAPRTMTGAASLVIYTRKQVSGGPNPTLRAYLRVFDPATGAHVEIGNAWAAINTNPKQAWSQRTFAWTLAGTVVPAGAQVEVKVVASGGTPDLEIAYDTTGQPSSLTLP